MRYQAIIGGIAIIGAIIFAIVSFSDIKYVGIEEEDSVFLEITEKHLLIEFSEKANSVAYYEGKKAIPLENIRDVHLGMPDPKSTWKVKGVGAQELKSGHWNVDEIDEYQFTKPKKDDPIITIELQGERYDRLVLETKDAQEIVQKIKFVAPITDCPEEKIMSKGKCITLDVIDDDDDKKTQQ